MRNKRLAHVAFATGTMSLGIVTIVFGVFAHVWQSVPGWVPGWYPLAYASAVLMLAGGIGLFSTATDGPPLLLAAPVKAGLWSEFAISWQCGQRRGSSPGAPLSPCVEVDVGQRGIVDRNAARDLTKWVAW